MIKKIKLKKSSSLFKRKINKKSKSIKLKDSNLLKSHKPLNKRRKVKKVTKRNDFIALNKRNNKKNDKILLDVIEKRYMFMIFVILVLFSIIGVRLFSLQVLENEEYNEKLVASTVKTIESGSAPRGRIYDRNYNLLVDNEAIKTIYYKKESGITTEEEVELAYKVGSMIDVDYSKLSEKILKNFWYINHKEEAQELITDSEWKDYELRKLDDDDIQDMIFERIADLELEAYDEVDKEASYIYYLMNKGYSYAEKVIKNVDVTDSEYALISENIDTLSGFNTKLDWNRIYLYGDTFKSILGSVSSSSQGIPSELSDYYLSNGYSLDDRVGISYLEYQYEDYLKGTKAIYKVNSDNSYELVSEGERGDDVVLTIDINLQQYLEEVLTEEVLSTKYEDNTKYYDHTFAIISDPRDGSILAMAGKKVVVGDDGSYSVIDYTPGIVTTSVTPGSIVKGASMLVGYKYGAINIGSYETDECIKIKATPLKCSWKTLGYINDIDALAYSSNVYQYKIAISVGGGNYVYDEALSINEEAFSKYRDMYASFGLGVKTGIDLPNESLGYSGESKLPGHLLDFAIGQYDTYTPIQISQYINTLANGGVRYQPYLLKEVYKASSDGESKFGEKIYSSQAVTLGNVDVESKYMDRVHEGFRAVVSYGLGYGYMGNYNDIGAGKTGTSQSFIDTDGDGTVDTETISTSFVGYAPYDDPEMSIVVVSPDVAVADASTTSSINKRISAKIVNKYFEIYK
jgi:cell division protein FtsI/penicillin-binding protein 2